MYKTHDIIRASRLPFITASILPFIFGSLIEKSNFNLIGFLLGLLAVVATHLSANLINDYADSKSGADWLDKRFFGFFGGSKLIQENIIPEGFYLRGAIILAIISAASVICLSFVLRSILPAAAYLAIIALSWSYSHKPLQFSYHRLGEIFIFLLFGPALVMGGYFIQSGIFPDMKSFLLSLPCGLLTTAILFANEVPDLNEDRKAGKFTWVSITGGKRAFLLYYLLVIAAFSSIVINIFLGYLKPFNAITLVFLLLSFKAAIILKKHYSEKELLVNSSKLTINVQALVTLVLILGVLL